MKLSNRSLTTLDAGDTLSEKTLKYLTRLGLIVPNGTMAGRTRASGSDGLPGKKNYSAGDTIYYFRLTEAGRKALDEAKAEGWRRD